LGSSNRFAIDGAFLLKNLTTGNPTRLMLRFTLPLIVGGILHQAYAITDAAVVGRVLGPEALAAVGSVGALLFLLQGFGWGTTNGLAIPVSKAFGSGDLSETRKMVAAGAYVAVVVAAIISFIGLVFGRAILNLIAIPDYLINDSALYLRILITGSAFTTTFAYLSAVIRAVGDSKTPVYFGIASQLLNAGLTIWFVVGMQWGIPGAASSTVIAQLLSLTICLTYASKRIKDIIPNRAEWRAGLSHATKSARTGLPMGLQTCSIAIGTVILQAAVNTLGGEAMAAYASAGRIEGITIAPLHAFNVATVTFVAQNRGAKHWLRIRQTVTKAAGIVGALALTLGTMQFIFARPLVGIFLPAGAGAPIQMAVDYVRITAWAFIILGLKFVIRGAVQGMGNSTIPTISTFLELVVRAALAFWLVNQFGLLGIAVAAPLAWCAGAGLNIVTWFKMRRTLLTRHEESQLATAKAKEYELQA
jgi:putative MATE family efflux protein